MLLVRNTFFSGGRQLFLLRILDNLMIQFQIRWLLNHFLSETPLSSSDWTARVGCVKEVSSETVDKRVKLLYIPVPNGKDYVFDPEPSFRMVDLNAWPWWVYFDDIALLLPEEKGNARVHLVGSNGGDDLKNSKSFRWSLALRHQEKPWSEPFLAPNRTFGNLLFELTELWGLHNIMFMVSNWDRFV
jgi:hypothetical protein